MNIVIRRSGLVLVLFRPENFFFQSRMDNNYICPHVVNETSTGTPLLAGEEEGVTVGVFIGQCTPIKLSDPCGDNNNFPSFYVFSSNLDSSDCARSTNKVADGCV